MKRVAWILRLLFIISAVSHAQTLFWDDPRVLEERSARFPQAAAGGDLVVVVWQEFVQDEVYLSLSVEAGGEGRTVSRRFAGPFPYQGDEAPIFSLAVDPQERLYVAIAAADREILLLLSEDGGRTFRQTRVEAPVTALAPRLSMRADGRPYLFVNYDRQDSVTIYFTSLSPQSFAGDTFTGALIPLIQEQSLVFNFLPSHVSFRGREYVVYQSEDKGQDALYQLFLLISDSGGRFVDPPVPLTDFAEIRSGRVTGPGVFENQRPHISLLGDTLAVAWERSLGGGTGQIYYMEIDAAGTPLGDLEVGADGTVLAPFERITESVYDSRFPRVFVFRDTVFVLWFDNRRGENRLIIAEREGQLWRERDITRLIEGNSIYPWPVERAGQLTIYWENQRAGRSQLVSVAPDQSVAAPTITARGVASGFPARRSELAVSWTIPPDASGIAGYSYSWSMDAEEYPGDRLRLQRDSNSVALEADEDGAWYFRIMALDFAGNWSPSAEFVLLRDTTPPPTVTFEPPGLDGNGFLVDNSPVFRWRPSEAEPVTGYTYRLATLASDPRAERPPQQVLASLSAGGSLRTQAASRAYQNIDNGLFAFSVAAIDLAGNIGQPSTILIRANKYVPVTIVRNVSSNTDTLGRITFSISGRGYTAQGPIEEIFIDRDGREPYDHVFRLAEGSYRIISDRLIDGPILARYERGRYMMGLVHPARGVFRTTPFLDLDTFGTVKIGPFGEAPAEPTWRRVATPRFVVSAGDVVVALIVVFLGLVALVSVKGLVAVAQEGRSLRRDVFRFLEGPQTAQSREELMRDVKSRGMGLRVKFTLLIAVLVLLVVLMVSIPLSYKMIQTQTRDLADGLRKRTNVLLGSISSAAGDFLLDQDTAGLRSLVDQIVAMPEAEYATITGIQAENANLPGQGVEYVWATNDASILAKIEGEELDTGRSVLSDQVSPLVADLSSKMNELAIAEVSDLARRYDQLVEEIRPFIGRNDDEARVRVEEFSEASTNLLVQINAILRRIGAEVGSVPPFSVDSLAERYVFYQPILQRSRSDIYYRGLVRVGVSAEEILGEIERSTRTLLFTIGVVALIALGLGIIGALILASITISPLRRLVAHVEAIRDAGDLAQFEKGDIEIRQQDEIRTLADTINDMTHGLVKAAIAAQELRFGKDVQKRFLPLAEYRPGQKGSTAALNTDQLEIYGYYEGAKGVSGDYFDYVDVGGGRYAVIKCDVAGKGVPAALIMVEVATTFVAAFRAKALGVEARPDRFVSLANDMIANVGFEGRFATLMVALIDSASGTCFMSNAGDNVVHLYDSSQNKMIIKQHPMPPAAGVFSSDLVDMQGGYQQTVEKLKPGDILLLITDGIEEAQRFYRNAQGEPIEIDEEETLEESGVELTLDRGGSELFSIPRIQRVIESVFNRERFQLRKPHHPLEAEDFLFDFTRCEGTLEEAVLAVVSVEKVFRLYTDPSTGPGDVIQVDKTVDTFLRDHFAQYSLYFRSPVEIGGDGYHVAYSGLKEDDQYDDLTVLAIRKK
jgi:serine phosphatase RsbU (regulator of sigma subunit)